MKKVKRSKPRLGILKGVSATGYAGFALDLAIATLSGVPGHQFTSAWRKLQARKAALQTPTPVAS